MSDLKAQELRQLLRYEPETGRLYWVRRPASMFAKAGERSADHCAAAWNSRNAGKEALTAPKDGYRQGKIFSRFYHAHRVAWALHHGEWPEGQIDHINGDRSDNRMANLRAVPQTENGRNQKRCTTNTSGVTGVNWHGQCGKWQAQIKVNNREIHLGLFVDFDTAVAARKAAEAKYGFHENHGR